MRCRLSLLLVLSVIGGCRRGIPKGMAEKARLLEATLRSGPRVRMFQEPCREYAAATVPYIRETRYHEKRRLWFDRRETIVEIQNWRVEAGVSPDGIFVVPKLDQKGEVFLVAYFPQPKICYATPLPSRTIWPPDAADERYEAEGLKRIPLPEVEDRVIRKVKKELLARTRRAIELEMLEESTRMGTRIEVRIGETPNLPAEERREGLVPRRDGRPRAASGEQSSPQ